MFAWRCLVTTGQRIQDWVWNPDWLISLPMDDRDRSVTVDVILISLWMRSVIAYRCLHVRRNLLESINLTYAKSCNRYCDNGHGLNERGPKDDLVRRALVTWPRLDGAALNVHVTRWLLAVCLQVLGLGSMPRARKYMCNNKKIQKLGFCIVLTWCKKYVKFWCNYLLPS